MIQVIIVIVLACGFLLACGFFTGLEVGQARRDRLADLQATLDRTARGRGWADEPRHLPYGGGRLELEPAGRVFPVDTGPMFLTLSEISAGWDRLEREQRGWPAP